MTMLISESLTKEIWAQIAHEKYNSQLYLYICGFLRNKGLDKLAKIFEQQYEEESKHALDFFNLLTDLSAPIKMLEIEEISIEFSSIKEVGVFYLQTEILTTESIDKIKKQAIIENCPVVEEKAREMLSKQQHEYEEATFFLDNALLCDGEDSWWKAKVWNDSLP